MNNEPKSLSKRAYVVGTCDTKPRELEYVRDLIIQAGQDAVLLDVGTRTTDPIADISATEIAMHHQGGPSAVFVDDRGTAVTNMAEALRAYILSKSDVGGIIGLGGSGGTGAISPAMQSLPIGIPKVMVSTLASGDVSAYVGPSDVNMFHSVTDVSGINRVSHKVLANAAHALAGMMHWQPPALVDDRQPIALSMFGVTTPCVQGATALLEEHYDCLVFHATGTGGRSMEKLVAQGDISGVLDLTTTEICDLLVGGVLSAGEGRLDCFAQSKIPYVGSCGALDMVNFWGMDSVPERFRDRNLYKHNDQITLMRTTAEECAEIGAWIGNKLNACEGPVRFLLPLKGVSALDVEGGQFHDPAADTALFEALKRTVTETEDRRILPVDMHINDPEFSAFAAQQFQDIMPDSKTRETRR